MTLRKASQIRSTCRMALRKVSMVTLSESGSVTYGTRRYTIYLNKLSTDANIEPVIPYLPVSQSQVHPMMGRIAMSQCSVDSMTKLRPVSHSQVYSVSEKTPISKRGTLMDSSNAEMMPDLVSEATIGRSCKDIMYEQCSEIGSRRQCATREHQCYNTDLSKLSNGYSVSLRCCTTDFNECSEVSKLKGQSVIGPPSLTGCCSVIGPPSLKGCCSVIGPPSLTGCCSVIGPPSLTGCCSVIGPPSLTGCCSVIGSPSLKGYCSSQRITKPEWQHAQRSLSTNCSVNSKLLCLQHCCSLMRNSTSRKIAFDISAKHSGTSNVTHGVPVSRRSEIATRHLGTGNVTHGVPVRRMSEIATRSSGTGNFTHGVPVRRMSDIATRQSGTSNFTNGVPVSRMSEIATRHLGTSIFTHGVPVRRMSEIATRHSGTSNFTHGVPVRRMSEIATRHSGTGIFTRGVPVRRMSDIATRHSGISNFTNGVPVRTLSTSCKDSMCMDAAIRYRKVPQVYISMSVSNTELVNKSAQHSIQQSENNYFSPFYKHLPCMCTCSDQSQKHSHCTSNYSGLRGGSSIKSMGYHSAVFRAANTCGKSSKSWSEVWTGFQMVPFSTSSWQRHGAVFCDSGMGVMIRRCLVRNFSMTQTVRTDGDGGTGVRNFSMTRRVRTDGRRDGYDGTLVRTQPPWRILFFGTDQIAVETLKALHENLRTSTGLVESLEVVTGTKQAMVDQSIIILKVRVFSETVDLDIHRWPIEIAHNKYDVGILVSFGHLIPDEVINMFPYGILNMHPSLLPRWRGASPIIHTVLHGDKMSGVSVMDIRPCHFDIGPVLLQRSCPVPPRVTSFQLMDRLGKLGASMVLECLKDLPTLERLEHEQDPEGVTYAHKISTRTATIDWVGQTAAEIDCQYRAISELIPLRSEWRGHGVKLLDVVDPVVLKDIRPETLRGYPGDITLAAPGTPALCKSTGCLVVKCKDGLIGFEKLVIKKTLSAQDFYNGYIISSPPGTRFTSLHNDINKYVRTKRIPTQSAV